MDREFKPIWKQVNKYFKRVSEEKQTQTVKKKEMKSEIYFNQDKKWNIWLEQNLKSGKASAIMSMIEQMVETRTW